ncbi:hypothetical protein B0H66DRAFT_594080 [Apodospora peruviana]|uniref:Uncharacterized protein n=1 Tax=Apodospora peruviana TaxID=516989 RepID=A0AAE0HZ32_9PEZI|nr:hypothetical protein B0H66DRAFT_594080 [Apodospora peruviana]
MYASPSCHKDDLGQITNCSDTKCLLLLVVISYLHAPSALDATRFSDEHQTSTLCQEGFMAKKVKRWDRMSEEKMGLKERMTHERFRGAIVIRPCPNSSLPKIRTLRGPGEPVGVVFGGRADRVVAVADEMFKGDPNGYYLHDEIEKLKVAAAMPKMPWERRLDASTTNSSGSEAPGVKEIATDGRQHNEDLGLSGFGAAKGKVPEQMTESLVRRETSWSTGSFGPVVGWQR